MKFISYYLLFLFGTSALAGEIVPIKKLLGEARVAIIEKAETCSAEMISSEITGAEDGILIYKVEPRGQTRQLSPEARDMLRDAILKDWNDDGTRYGCMPLPGVRYVFRNESDYVSLLVCYRCKAVIVEDKGRAVAGRSGRDISGELRNVAASFLSKDEIDKLP